MGGLLILGLIILFLEALAPWWPWLLALALIVAVWWLVGRLWRDARAAERDRLRHEAARREIDRIALATQRQMFEAARSHGEVIEGTAVEIGRD